MTIVQVLVDTYDQINVEMHIDMQIHADMRGPMWRNVTLLFRFDEYSLTPTKTDSISRKLTQSDDENWLNSMMID